MKVPNLFYTLKDVTTLENFHDQKKKSSSRPKKLTSLVSGKVIISYPVLVF